MVLKCRFFFIISGAFKKPLQATSSKMVIRKILYQGRKECRFLFQFKTASPVDQIKNLKEKLK